MFEKKLNPECNTNQPFPKPQ